MRIRCSRGLKISNFHGHFFIRSTDLLALPQVSLSMGIFFNRGSGKRDSVRWVAAP